MLIRTESRRMGASAPRDISDLAINGPVPALLLLDPRRAVRPRRGAVERAPAEPTDAGLTDSPHSLDADDATSDNATSDDTIAGDTIAGDTIDEDITSDDTIADDTIDEPAPLLAWLHRAERTPRAELGDPRPHAARTAQLMLEVLAGQRPATALRAVAHPDVIQRLAAASQGFTHQQTEQRRRAIRPTVGRVIVSEPRDGIAEATVIIREGRRSRALALRLEGLQGHWTATIAELG